MTSRQEAIQRAGAHLAETRLTREGLANTYGAEVVARWAEPTGTPEQLAELAAYYEHLQAEAGGTTAA